MRSIYLCPTSSPKADLAYKVFVEAYELSAVTVWIDPYVLIDALVIICTPPNLLNEHSRFNVLFHKTK